MYNLALEIDEEGSNGVEYRLVAAAQMQQRKLVEIEPL